MGALASTIQLLETDDSRVLPLLNPLVVMYALHVALFLIYRYSEKCIVSHLISCLI
jgi:hypothetical protein